MYHQTPAGFYPDNDFIVQSRVPFYRLAHSEFRSNGRTKRQRSLCSRVACYILAVVLIQNVLMTYNFAVRKSSIRGEIQVSNASALVVGDRGSMAPSGLRHVASDVDDASIVRKADQSVPTTTKVLPTEKEYFRRRPTKVNPFMFHVRLAPKDVCREDTRMIVVVHSHPNNADRRGAIRETWGRAITSGTWPHTSAALPASEALCCQGIQLVFVVGLHASEAVGKAVESEFIINRDIVQGDFLDDYRNMTLKSLLDLKFVKDRCPKVEYLLKSDDDMIINLPYLMVALRSQGTLSRFIMGPHNAKSKVYRDGVWALSMDEYPFERFPPYESGAAYVISGDVIGELFDTAEYVPPIFIDDVYITGILGRILDLKHIKHGGFAFWGSARPTACSVILGKILTGTKMHPQRLMELWQEISLGPKC